MRLPIAERTGMVRDINSMAILSSDRKVLTKDELFKAKMKREKEVDEAINSLQANVEDINNKLNRILELLNSRG